MCEAKKKIKNQSRKYESKKLKEKNDSIKGELSFFNFEYDFAQSLELLDSFIKLKL